MSSWCFVSHFLFSTILGMVDKMLQTPNAQVVQCLSPCGAQAVACPNVPRTCGTSSLSSFTRPQARMTRWEIPEGVGLHNEPASPTEGRCLHCRFEAAISIHGLKQASILNLEPATSFLNPVLLDCDVRIQAGARDWV